MTTTPGKPIWTPPQDGRGTNIEQFARWLRTRRGVTTDGYHELHSWSVDQLESFWGALWEYFHLGPRVPDEQVLPDPSMPAAVWFPGVRLNYVDQVLAHAQRPGPAILDVREPGARPGRDLSWADLVAQVGALADWLTRQGVRPGDRVVGYLPNVPEAVVAFLATASLGAIWSACGQDYAADAAISRLGQLRPSVLVTADGYRFNGRDHDRRDAVDQLRAALPGLKATLLVDRIGAPPPAHVTSWREATRRPARLTCRPVTFDHPLWVLFSSGTTGKPKGIVHGHGGVLLEHLKQVVLHLDLGPDQTYFWYTSPSWMMWNFQVAGLLAGTTIVCYDGSPTCPGTDGLWSLSAEHHVNVMGTSPGYLQACQKAGAEPARDHDLHALRTLGVTGSVTPASTYAWVAQHVGSHIPLASTAGGTDVVTAFAGAAPTVPIWAGELSAPCLGVALESWDPDGHPLIDQVGELVVTAPMPSMPVRFWDDPDGTRLHDAYFSTYPGVWRHGDWITMTRKGSVIMYGRSDATLNRNGVRMGTSDIYDAVEQMPEIVEALIIGAELPDGTYRMPLFVQLREDVTFDDDLTTRIRDQIRASASPRHIPDEIYPVPTVPHTKTGKKLEVPVKRLFQGSTLEEVIDIKSVDHPESMTLLAEIASATRP